MHHLLSQERETASPRHGRDAAEITINRDADQGLITEASTTVPLNGVVTLAGSST